MTVNAWLRSRTPPAPDRLLERVGEVLGDRGVQQSAHTAEVCLEAADELLRDLMHRPSAGRDSALDLLTVDALVTYAFEAVADSATELDATTTAAMRRFGAIAQE